MTLEELKQVQKKLQEERQNEFIDKLVDMVECLLEKANKKDYEPTEHERNQFRKIHTIITDMNRWF